MPANLPSQTNRNLGEQTISNNFKNLKAAQSFTSQHSGVAIFICNEVKKIHPILVDLWPQTLIEIIATVQQPTKPSPKQWIVVAHYSKLNE